MLPEEDDGARRITASRTREHDVVVEQPLQRQRRGAHGLVHGLGHARLLQAHVARVEHELGHHEALVVEHQDLRPI